MNSKARFSAIRACCGFGCRRDTTSLKMRAATIPFSISTTDRTCSIPQRHTSASTGRWANAASRLIAENKIPPLIVVGIDNAQKDRPKEYLPYRSMHPPILRPQGKRYPDFLLNEVMPFVYREYRIARGPENTGLGGSSLGAIISLFTVMDRPGIFGRLLLESPSLFISNRQLLRSSRAFRQWPDKIFMAMGTREAGSEQRDRQAVEDVRDLEHVLRRAGLGEDRLLVKIDEGASHSERDWARRFPEALTFLFGITDAA